LNFFESDHASSSVFDDIIQGNNIWLKALLWFYFSIFICILSKGKKSEVTGKGWEIKHGQRYTKYKCEKMIHKLKENFSIAGYDLDTFSCQIKEQRFFTNARNELED